MRLVQPAESAPVDTAPVDTGPDRERRPYAGWDLPLQLTATLLDGDEEAWLAGRIEAGVLAEARLAIGRNASVSEAAELRQLVTEGDLAQRRLAEANLRLVVMVARQAAIRSRIGVSDLFQEGCVGLLLSVQRWDHRRGARFATYALHWIRAYVGAASASQLGDLNVPVGRAAVLRSARGIAETVAQQAGRSMAVEELAAHLGRSTRWTGTLLATRAPVSLDGREGANVLEALVADPGRRDPAASDRLAQRLLSALPPVQRDVLVLRMGFEGEPPLPYAQVSKRLGLPVSRVKRIEAAALERLRERCPHAARELIGA